MATFTSDVNAGLWNGVCVAVGVSPSHQHDPSEVAGGWAAHLLDAIPNTWEYSDENTSINEGAAVFQYRDKYYLIYNANHTSDGCSSCSRGGNYGFGCAQADSPLGFRNSSKYRNHIRLDPIFVMDSASHSGPEERIQNVGQPWVVEGPNGFERWLGYFAIYDPVGLGGRYQACDRIQPDGAICSRPPS